MQDKQNEVQTSHRKKLNGLTITAIVMASVGFLINPFSTISILGIVFGGIGVAKSVSSRDKMWAIISLSVSVMETLLWAVTFANALASL
jgi:hypothetical protein